MKYILTFENYTSAPLSKGAEIEQVYNEGGELRDKYIDKETTPEQIEALEEEEEKITKRVKEKKVADKTTF